jgi:hypothetical protein
MQRTEKTMRVTSSGVIRNEDKPRVGVLSANGPRASEWIFDEIDQGTDLTWEEFSKDIDDQIAAVEASDQDSDAKEQAIAKLERERDSAELNSRTVIFGDAWAKNAAGQYEIDRTKEYAASYSSDTNIITVEWSKHTTRCHHTSPCYVMADGSGPCGDLDTPGDSVVAFTLPPDLLAAE